MPHDRTMRMPPLPEPAPDEISEPFWAAVREGRLVFQQCHSCGHRWLPPRRECPNCLAADNGWQPASGAAKLISWVVYHLAYNPAFADRLPYNVAIVELAEGPRMISNIVGIDDHEGLVIDQQLDLCIENDGGVQVPRFKPLDSAS